MIYNYLKCYPDLTITSQSANNKHLLNALKMQNMILSSWGFWGADIAQDLR